MMSIGLGQNFIWSLAHSPEALQHWKILWPAQHVSRTHLDCQHLTFNQFAVTCSNKMNGAVWLACRPRYVIHTAILNGTQGPHIGGRIDQVSSGGGEICNRRAKNSKSPSMLSSTPYGSPATPPPSRGLRSWITCRKAGKIGTVRDAGMKGRHLLGLLL